MKVSLIYQEASDGLTPAGGRYDPYLMISDEIIGPIEEELGEELDGKVWIRASSKSEGKSIATEYVLHCKGAEDGEKVLQMIAERYNAYFLAHYTMNDSVLHYESQERSVDYIETSDYMEAELRKITSFLTKQIKEDGSWRAKDGTTYHDLLRRAQNILDVDIYNFRAYITENGITKNVTLVKSEYRYRNMLLEMDREKAEEQYKNRVKAIELYDPTLFPTISVPSIKNGEYYVTTTKTGLDYIYDAASSFSESAYKLQMSKSKNDMTVQNMSLSQKSEEAETQINEIEGKITRLIEDIKAVNEEYMESTKTSYLVFGEVQREK